LAELSNTVANATTQINSTRSPRKSNLMQTNIKTTPQKQIYAPDTHVQSSYSEAVSSSPLQVAWTYDIKNL